MKILSIGNFGFGWDGSICDEEHIASALEKLGHTVIRQQRETGWDSPVPNVDFVLISQWDGYPERMGFKDAGVPVVYWAFDHQARDQKWHVNLIAQADLYLSKRLSDNMFPNWQWLSQDFAPSFLDNVYKSGDKKDIDVLFTGSYLPWATDRTEILKTVDKHFDLHICSVTSDAWERQGFKNVHAPVMDDELPALIARARINISIDHTIEAGYWSDRNAQIMACGGYVMFKYVPLSRSVFKDHITYFDDADDCLDRLGQLLERPQEDLDAVADGGYKYAHEYMMVEDRVKDLLTIVENTVL